MEVTENGLVRYRIMKWIFLIISILGSFFVDAQLNNPPIYFTFAGEFSIMEMNILGEQSCTPRTRAVWQIRRDTMYFIFNEKIIKMNPLNKKKYKERFKRRSIKRDIDYIEKHNRIYGNISFIYLMENERKEIYYIVFTMPTRRYPGFSIFICDMQFRYPHYLLVFDINANICAGEKLVN